MKTYKSIIRGTLAWCNRQRAKQHKKPLKKLPKGFLGDGRSCPCGTATDLYVGQTYFCSKKDVRAPYFHTTLPKVVARFVELFDSEKIPTLIAKWSRLNKGKGDSIPLSGEIMDMHFITRANPAVQRIDSGGGARLGNWFTNENLREHLQERDLAEP